jgi:hypothetical protein
MQCVKRKLFALAVLAMVAFTPNVSFAAGTCECFCGATGSGATSADQATPEQCRKTCDSLAGDYKMIGCFTDDSDYPVESDKCWTAKECDDWSEEYNGVSVGATWGTVFPADCSVTKSSSEPMHYCYADDVPYDLNIHIGNVTEVQNLPEYINVIYTWMLPAASLVAVVMMMIGGLQYTLSRGKSKYIEKAKTRITNAITGIVILMSAYVILNLIDPRLVSFETLKIPLIKKVTMLDATSSCERLEDYGYTIEPVAAGSEACGNKGTIKDDSLLKDNALGSWKIGDTCDYYSCETPGTTCTAYHGTNMCFACAGNFSPSESSCNALDKSTGGGTTTSPYYEYCRYTPEKTHASAEGDLDSGTCYGVQNPSTSTSEQYLNCSLARTKSELHYREGELKGPCEYYETLKAAIYPLNDNLNTKPYREAFEEICSNDVCGVAEESDAVRCNFSITNPGSDDETYTCASVFPSTK